MKPGAKVDAALETIAAAFNRTIQPGEIAGTLVDQDGELEIEVTLRVTRRVSSTNAARFRARAMALLAVEAWRDRCPAQVKNRGSWSVTKTKSCTAKVSTVVVYRGYEYEEGPLRPGEIRRLLQSERFHFGCSHHADETGPDVLAIVRLEQAPLRALRAKRQAESDARIARERAKERELEVEVRALSDSDLARRLDEFIVAHAWGSEDVCLREQRRRGRERDEQRRNTKPADLPVSNSAIRGGS